MKHISLMRLLCTAPIFYMVFFFGTYFKWYENALVLLVGLAILFEPQLIKFEDKIYIKARKLMRKFRLYVARKVHSSEAVMNWVYKPRRSLSEALADYLFNLTKPRKSVSETAAESFRTTPLARSTWRNSFERGDYIAK